MFQVLSKSVKGFPNCDGPKMRGSQFPWTLTVALTTGQHCRAACDPFSGPGATHKISDNHHWLIVRLDSVTFSMSAMSCKSGKVVTINCDEYQEFQ